MAVVVVVGLAGLVEEKGNVQLKQDRGAGEEEGSILFSRRFRELWISGAAREENDTRQGVAGWRTAVNSQQRTRVLLGKAVVIGHLRKSEAARSNAKRSQSFETVPHP